MDRAFTLTLAETSTKHLGGLSVGPGENNTRVELLAWNTAGSWDVSILPGGRHDMTGESRIGRGARAEAGSNFRRRLSPLSIASEDERSSEAVNYN